MREHTAALAELGEQVRPVRRPADLVGLDGLVIPGGESTTLSLLLGSSGLFEPLFEALHCGLPVFGTCAGMILLAGEVLDGRPDQKRFDMIDVVVRRNGYGRQSASFECDLDVSGIDPPPVHAVFIRAPVVEAAGSGVEVLARLPRRGGITGDGSSGRPDRESDDEGLPVVCRQDRVLVAAFHPELAGDYRLHRLFVDMTKESRE